jgi:hypothetical protein
MASLFTGTVEEYANLASFPLVGVADTIYIALDTNVLYRWDTGLTSYVELSPNIINSLVFNDANGFDGTISLVGSVATLTITTALTTGSVGFIGASGALLQDNANFFWDDTNNRLGIGTNAPTTAIDTFGSGIITRVNGTSTNNAFIGFASAGTNKWSVGNVQSDHRFRIYNEATTSELVSVLQTGEFGIGIANPTTKLHIDGGASALIANLDANVSVAKSISFRSDNSNRINLEVSGTESGSNAGANFFLRTYTDAGALLATPLTITRSTGAISLATALSGTTASFTGLIRTDLGAAGTSGTFTGTGSNFQINHDGSSAITLINSGGGGYVFKAGDLTTTIFSLSNAGAASFLSSIEVGTGTYSAGLSKLYSTSFYGTILTGKAGSLSDLLLTDRAGNVAFQIINNGSTPNSIFGGNVGIGTSLPGAQLEVMSTTGGIIRLKRDDSSVTTDESLGTLQFHTNDGDGAHVAAYIRGLGADLPGQNFGRFGALSFGVSKTANTDAVEAMRIDLSGNVGIGSTNPDVPLLIGGVSTLTATANPTAMALDNSYFNGTTSGDKLKLYILRGGVNIGFGAGNIGDFNIWCDGLTRFYNGGSERMRITSSGNILISTTTDLGYKFQVNGNITGTGVIYSFGTGAGLSTQNRQGSNYYVWIGQNAGMYLYNDSIGFIGEFAASNGAYTALSDINKKKDFEKSTIGLDAILNLKPTLYRMKTDNENTEKQLGFIAQEVKEFIPQAYTESGNNDNKFIGLQDRPIIAALVKAVQEQQEQIEELKALINK